VVSLFVVLVALAGIGGLGGVAAADDAEIESVSVDDDASFAGVTETHTVTVETANAPENAAVELDFEPWAGNVTDVDAKTGTVLEGPTDGTVTVEPDNEDVVVTAGLVHPTAADTFDIDAALVDGSGATLDAASAAIDVQSVGLTVNAGDEAQAVGSNDAQTATVEFGLGEDFADTHGETLVVSSPDLTDDELAEILEAATDSDGEVTRTNDQIRVTPDSYVVSFRDFDAATYRIEASPVASTVFTLDGIDVVEPEIEGSFGTDHHQVPAGDLVTVEPEISGTTGGISSSARTTKTATSARGTSSISSTSVRGR